MVSRLLFLIFESESRELLCLGLYPLWRGREIQRTFSLEMLFERLADSSTLSTARIFQALSTTQMTACALVLASMSAL